MTQVRERLWLWGHEAGSHNQGWGIPGPSRITPVEAAFYMGIPNVIMVRYEGAPPLPFDRYAIPFRSLERVYWSVVGSSGGSSDEERAHVYRLAGQMPNVEGLFMDDFFQPYGLPGKLAALSVEQVQDVRRRLASGPRRLNLGLTLYTYQLELPLADYLPLFDKVSLWTWKAADLARLEQNFARFEEITPGRGRWLGLYMWDYGEHRPMPVDLMQRQTALGYEWLRAGRVDGLIFLASCICDLELEAVEWARAWIARTGRQEL